MGKARCRRKIGSLQERIREHQEKIEGERLKATADQGLIHHWEREIKAFQDGIRGAQKRRGTHT